jgi:DNA-binding NarL/FixJ family response regulator
MIRILIVDDHDIVRQGLKRLFEKVERMTIIAEQDNGVNALHWLRNNDCDVVLLDISMPGLSGIEVLKQMRDEKPKLPILIFSNYTEDQYAMRLIKAGASGYVCKGSDSAVVVEAIRDVVSGKKYFSRAVLELLINEIIIPEGKLPHDTLSEREFMVFNLLVAGNSINEVATQIFISNKTVSTHKTNLLKKMNLHNVPDLVRYAVKHGLVE